MRSIWGKGENVLCSYSTYTLHNFIEFLFSRPLVNFFLIFFILNLWTAHEQSSEQAGIQKHLIKKYTQPSKHLQKNTMVCKRLPRLCFSCYAFMLHAFSIMLPIPFHLLNPVLSGAPKYKLRNRDGPFLPSSRQAPFPCTFCSSTRTNIQPSR